MKRSWMGVAALVALLSTPGILLADPPTEFDYQGKILINDIPLTGSGYFKYAISDEAGTTNFWSHDGATTGEPATYLTNDCYNGVFSAVVGGLPMAAIDPAIFAVDTSLYLRVWFSSDAVTFDEMLPAQPLLSAPFAINADMLDGYHAADIIAAASGALVETDPVFGASVASVITPIDLLNWNLAFGWGDHAVAGYLTSYSETDPIFGASAAAGITAGNIADWSMAFGWGDHAAAGYLTAYSETDPVWTAASNLYYQRTEADTRFVEVAGDTMTGMLAINDSASSSLRIHSTYSAVAIGTSAAGGLMGVAIGANADATSYGAAMGYQAEGTQNGVAIGYNTRAFDSGVALGSGTRGTNFSVAVGAAAWAARTNIAVGFRAAAGSGQNRIAIGNHVTNDVNDTARLRGELYMDGGMAVFGRMPFGTGSFQKLLPLPPMDNVVYVAANGTPMGPGTVDRPFDTPQAGYNHSATVYAGQPATLVIAAGVHPGLVMGAGNVHVIGLSRAELATLDITAAANSIRGKQRVENLIVAGVTVVAADLGEDVKFYNCRFEGGLLIYGPRVEVQNCFATTGDGPAVIVGDGINNIVDVALTQSSFANASPVQGTLIVNQGVIHFEVIGCQIVNHAGGACIEDLQLTPITPVHLYTHNYLRGMPPVPGSTPAVQDAALTGETIAFTHNTVMGDVGLNGNLQFFANNVVYGRINYGGPGAPGWTQAGAGTGLDAAGNTEHESTYPPLPASWKD